MNDSPPKYACPRCGCLEMIVGENDYSIWVATREGKVGFLKTEIGEESSPPHCRECGVAIEIAAAIGFNNSLFRAATVLIPTARRFFA